MDDLEKKLNEQVDMTTTILKSATRNQFAAAALMGLLANRGTIHDPKYVVATAFEYADEAVKQSVK